MANKSSIFKLEMLILNVLKNGDCYGYQLNKQLKSDVQGKITITDGNMYNILYRLLDNGYISCYDKRVDKKIRVYYHLEPSGELYLKELVDEFDSVVRLIQDLIHP